MDLQTLPIVFVNSGGFTMPALLGGNFSTKTLRNKLSRPSEISLSCYHFIPIQQISTRVGDVVKELPDVAIHVLIAILVLIVQLNATPTLFSLSPLWSPDQSKGLKIGFLSGYQSYDEVDQMTQRIHQLELTRFSLLKGTNHVENGENQEVFADDQVQGEMSGSLIALFKEGKREEAWTNGSIIIPIYNVEAYLGMFRNIPSDLPSFGNSIWSCWFARPVRRDL